jgi:hypothetical protein
MNGRNGRNLASCAGRSGVMLKTASGSRGRAAEPLWSEKNTSHDSCSRRNVVAHLIYLMQSNAHQHAQNAMAYVVYMSVFTKQFKFDSAFDLPTLPLLCSVECAAWGEVFPQYDRIIAG